MKDKEIDHTWIIDIAVPGDKRIEEKEREKIEKYQDIARETRRLWKTLAMVITIVVGALGAVAKLEEYIRMLDIEMGLPAHECIFSVFMEWTEYNSLLY